jgi:hypothetical protein
MLETFSATLREETYLDSLDYEVVGPVRRTMQPVAPSQWLRYDNTPSKDWRSEQQLVRAPKLGGGRFSAVRCLHLVALYEIAARQMMGQPEDGQSVVCGRC